MEAKAVAKYVRVSPRKARVVIDQVRGKDVVRAREILRFSERAIAETIENDHRCAEGGIKHGSESYAHRLPSRHHRGLA